MLDLEIAIIEQVTITCREDDIQHVTRWSREHDFCITNVSAETFIKSEACVYVVTAQRPFDVSAALSKDQEARGNLFSGLSAASREMDTRSVSVNPRMFERSMFELPAVVIEADVRLVKLTRDDRKALLAAASHCLDQNFSVMDLLSKSAWEQLEDLPEKIDDSP